MIRAAAFDRGDLSKEARHRHCPPGHFATLDSVAVLQESRLKVPQRPESVSEDLWQDASSHGVKAGPINLPQNSEEASRRIRSSLDSVRQISCSKYRVISPLALDPVWAAKESRMGWPRAEFAARRMATSSPANPFARSRESDESTSSPPSRRTSGRASLGALRRQVDTGTVREITRTFVPADSERWKMGPRMNRERSASARWKLSRTRRMGMSLSSWIRSRARTRDSGSSRSFKRFVRPRLPRRARNAARSRKNAELVVPS